jgi:hypothetical protein
MRKGLAIAMTMALILPLVSVNAFADDDLSKGLAPQAAFEQLKTLTGEWEGTAGPQSEGERVRVTYRVTANGSALIETEFAGSEHEMISVFHLDGDRLMMTHYCAMGNQPQMVLSGNSTNREMSFDFLGGTNMNPKTDGHIHAGRIRFLDSDTIESEWDFYSEGQKAESKTFYLSRVN